MIGLDLPADPGAPNEHAAYDRFDKREKGYSKVLLHPGQD